MKLATSLVTPLTKRLRQHRDSRPTPPGRGARDLPTEIRVYLTEHPGSLTDNIAGGIRARTSDVRSVLNTDPAFVRASRGPGENLRGIRWVLAAGASEPVLQPRTGTRGDGT